MNIFWGVHFTNVIGSSWAQHRGSHNANRANEVDTRNIMRQVNLHRAAHREQTADLEYAAAATDPGGSTGGRNPWSRTTPRPGNLSLRNMPRVGRTRTPPSERTLAHRLARRTRVKRMRTAQAPRWICCCDCCCLINQSCCRRCCPPTAASWTNSPPPHSSIHWDDHITGMITSTSKNAKP